MKKRDYRALPKKVRDLLESGSLTESVVLSALTRARSQAQRLKTRVDPADILLELDILSIQGEELKPLPLKLQQPKKLRPKTPRASVPYTAGASSIEGWLQITPDLVSKVTIAKSDLERIVPAFKLLESHLQTRGLLAKGVPQVLALLSALPLYELREVRDALKTLIKLKFEQP